MWALLGKGHNKETPPAVPLFKPRRSFFHLSAPGQAEERNTSER